LPRSASPARALFLVTNVCGCATALTNAKGSFGYFAVYPEGLRLMQTIILSCAFVAVCTMVLFAAGAAGVKCDLMIRRGGKLLPPEEF
jgi:hypothetical protein